MQFNAEKVTKIYMGKDVHCRCGCGGEYVERGEPKFDLRVKRFASMWENYVPKEDDVDSSFFNVSYGQNRALTVYFD